MLATHMKYDVNVSRMEIYYQRYLVDRCLASRLVVEQVCRVDGSLALLQAHTTMSQVV